ncbi:MAG: hypothetical protein FJX66_15515 [Alphaproteobacteria bacterium]|nr:hypothetical protein [Alphaproteobacteria bacterium]
MVAASAFGQVNTFQRFDGEAPNRDPFHLFIMLWAATQFYADFSSVVCNVLGAKRLTRAHFEEAAACISSIAIEGLKNRRRPKSARLRRG